MPLHEEGNLYPPNISPKIAKVYVENRTGDGTPDIEVYMGSETPMNIKGWSCLTDVLPKRTPVTAIIQPRIWFVSGRFGVTLRVLQLKVLSVSRSGPPRGYSFSKPPAKLEAQSSDATVVSEDEASDNVGSDEPVSAEAEQSEEEEVVDSEDEESDDEVEEVEA